MEFRLALTILLLVAKVHHGTAFAPLPEGRIVRLRAPELPTRLYAVNRGAEAGETTTAAVLILSMAALFGGSTQFVSAADVQEFDVANGSKVFESNCAACHVGGGNAFSKEKTLRREALEKWTIGTDVDGVRGFVRDGLLHRGAMLFGGQLTDEEYTDVSAYVIDQALGEKW